MLLGQSRLEGLGLIRLSCESRSRFVRDGLPAHFHSHLDCLLVLSLASPVEACLAGTAQLALRAVHGLLVGTKVSPLILLVSLKLTLGQALPCNTASLAPWGGEKVVACLIVAPRLAVDIPVRIRPTLCPRGRSPSMADPPCISGGCYEFLRDLRW